MTFIFLKTAFIAWFIAQITKFILCSVQKKALDFPALVASGGMPSSHTALVSSITLKIGLLEGINSSTFAICVIFSCIIMYDAMNVRRSVGIQGEKINEIVEDLGLINSKKIEKIPVVFGHSFIEVVAGLIVGVIVALWLS